MRIMIKTKSVYDPVEKADGRRFLVTRYWPRRLSKNKLKLTEWLHELAPSKELLRDWKKAGITWQEYELRYIAEMQNQQEPISRLVGLSRKGTITLLCFEKEADPHCHRHLLKKMIETNTK